MAGALPAPGRLTAERERREPGVARAARGLFGAHEHAFAHMECRAREHDRSATHLRAAVAGRARARVTCGEEVRSSAAAGAQRAAASATAWASAA